MKEQGKRIHQNEVCRLNSKLEAFDFKNKIPTIILGIPNKKTMINTLLSLAKKCIFESKKLQRPIHLENLFKVVVEYFKMKE